MVIRIVWCSFALSGLLLADTVVLRSGRSVEGQYLGGNSRQVRVEVGERIETFNIDDVSQIRFGSDTASPTSSSSTTSASGSSRTGTGTGTRTATANSPATPPRDRTGVMRPEPSAGSASSTTARSASSGTSTSSRTATSTAQVPEGTVIVIRMIDDVDSERDTVGQEFRASVDEAVLVGNRTVVPRGADVTVKLVADRKAGELSGRTELTLDLVAVQLNGRMVEVLSQEVTTQSESQTNRTAKVVGGTAALGAIIGAIAGGGKGAAIGAVTGAAAGGAVQVLTKGPTVKIPSETRLSFTLQQPLRQ